MHIAEAHPSQLKFVKVSIISKEDQNQNLGVISILVSIAIFILLFFHYLNLFSFSWYSIALSIGLRLRKLTLDPVVVIFFKICQEITITGSRGTLHLV